MAQAAASCPQSNKQSAMISSCCSIPASAPASTSSAPAPSAPPASYLAGQWSTPSAPAASKASAKCSKSSRKNSKPPWASPPPTASQPSTPATSTSADGRLTIRGLTQSQTSHWRSQAHSKHMSINCIASHDYELAGRLPLQRAREILTELKRQMAGEGESHG